MIILFLLWRGFDFFIIMLAAKLIPYLGFFPYGEILPGYHLPEWVSKLANFDGVHYLLIAQQGYMQYEQAYFPLYPLLINILNPLFLKNTLLTSLVISNVSFLIGLIILSRVLSDYLKKNQRFWLYAFLLSFPTSFFFGAVYTEGLFFLFLTLVIYGLSKKNYWLVIVGAFFASLTRLIGVFLIIPIIFHFVNNLRFKSPHFDAKRVGFKKFHLISTILAPIFGLLTYMTYLWTTVKDPLFFFNSQPIFGAQRTTNLILLPQVYWRYFKIFFTAQWDFRYLVSMFEFVIFTFIFIVLIIDLINLIQNSRKDYFLVGLNLFSVANLILPTLTGTFSSIPRYALFSISAFLFLAKLNRNSVKIIIILFFLIMHILLLSFFAQGYFVS